MSETIHLTPADDAMWHTRRFVEQVCEATGREDGYVLRLVASELVAEAWRVTPADAEIVVQAGPKPDGSGHFLIEVWTPADRFGEGEWRALAGVGLVTRWGTRTESRGITVWAEVV